MHYKITSTSVRSMVINLNSGKVLRLPLFGSFDSILVEELDSPELQHLKRRRKLIVTPIRSVADKAKPVELPPPGEAVEEEADPKPEEPKDTEPSNTAPAPKRKRTKKKPSARAGKK